MAVTTKEQPYEVIIDEIEEACKRIEYLNTTYAFEAVCASLSALLRVLEKIKGRIPIDYRRPIAEKLSKIMERAPLDALDQGVKRDLPESTREKFRRAIRAFE